MVSRVSRPSVAFRFKSSGGLVWRVLPTTWLSPQSRTSPSSWLPDGSRVPALASKACVVFWLRSLALVFTSVVFFCGAETYLPMVQEALQFRNGPASPRFLSCPSATCGVVCRVLRPSLVPKIVPALIFCRVSSDAPPAPSRSTALRSVLLIRGQSLPLIVP